MVWFFFSITYGMSSFLLTNSYVSRWFLTTKQQSSYVAQKNDDFAMGSKPTSLWLSQRDQDVSLENPPAKDTFGRILRILRILRIQLVDGKHPILHELPSFIPLSFQLVQELAPLLVPLHHGAEKIKATFQDFGVCIATGLQRCFEKTTWRPRERLRRYTLWWTN